MRGSRMSLLFLSVACHMAIHPSANVALAFDYLARTSTEQLALAFPLGRLGNLVLERPAFL